MARVIAIFADKKRVGEAVDSLRVAGFDRQDMVISDSSTDPDEEELDGSINLKSEPEALGEEHTYNSYLPDLARSGAITLTIEIPAREKSRVAEILRHGGAEKVYVE
ncbi:MAG: hypothetical protein M1553_00175 [Firmicutes bacterium]|nr:hypothetical protein [Bacillota bacterium]